jgi:hypothetical protein
MIRKLTIVALAIVGLQICEILTLGTSPSGSLFTNCLQILASGIAAAMCFAACKRGHGLSRPFWLLVGCGLAMWGVANLSWMYYENWLHREPPSTSIVRFFFQAEGIFLAVALFQDEDKDSPKLNLASFLDLAQIGIVFFFVYFGLYFVPILRGNSQNALAREALTEMGENAALVVLAVIRMKWARTPRLRRLYGELTVFLLVYLVGSGIAEWAQSLHEVPTGTWYDLGWTVPLLAGERRTSAGQKAKIEIAGKVCRRKCRGGSSSTVRGDPGGKRRDAVANDRILAAGRVDPGLRGASGVERI